ncbi:MAG: hypothetical protein K1W13_07155 [Lachnospiraceae bacterium]
MGFWKWLFGRKKQEEAQEEWEETVYERGKVNFNEAEERTRYLTGCLEQIGEAQKEMQLLNGEYAIVTSYLTDMEEIEALPPEHMAEIKGCAGKMQTLEADRRRYLDKERHLSEAEYRQMRSQENEIEEGIAKLQEAERYRKLVRQDLARLDGERHAYGYRKQELRTGLVNLKGMAVICLTALLACIFMLLILQFGFHMNTAVGYYVSAGAAAIAITVLFVKYADTEKELARVETAANKLIHLQNKVKIRYVNNTNLLEYLYLKYGVESAVKLKEQWDMYQEEKEERRQYAEAEAKLEYYRKQLIRLLIQFRVKDPERWVMQPGAIIDARERLEIRHDLVARRQALRKQLAYNQQLAEAAQQEIKDVAAEYPHYAAEIAEMVEKYEEKYG